MELSVGLLGTVIASSNSYCKLGGTSSHAQFENATPEQRSIHAETIVQDNGVNEKRAPVITF